MGKQIFNPLLLKRFQELSSGGAGGGEDLAATLILGQTTGGQNIILTGSDAIKSINSQLLLNDTFGAWLLTYSSIIDGSTEFQTSYIWGDGTSVFMEQGADSGVSVGTSSAKIYMSASASGLISDAYMYLGLNQMGFGDEAVLNFSTIQIKNNLLSAKGSSGGANRALFLNSLSSTINIGVDNSLILGGNNLTAKTSNTPYANQISLQPSGNLFDGILEPSPITGDQTWTMPDKSGTVALLSDTTGYTQTGQTTNGTQFTLPLSYPLSTTSGNHVTSFIIRITAFQSAGTAGTFGDVWVHEIRGAVKIVGSLGFLVDTVTDESIAEDIGALGFSATADIGVIPYGGVDVKVTGELNKTIEWKAVGIFNEIVL